MIKISKLLVVCLLSLFVELKSQNITLSLNNSNLKTFFTLVEKQTNYRFSYNPNEIDINASISLNCTDKNVQSVLDSLMPSLGISYTIVNNQIILRNQIGDKHQKKYTISGYVMSLQTNEILPGALIFVDNILRTQANEYGFFSITLAEGKYKLKFSHIGYYDTITHIQLSKNLQINAKLEISTQKLPDIKVNPQNTVQLRNNRLDAFVVKQLQMIKQSNIAGISDALKILFTLPGVNYLGDGSLNFYVRGSDKSHNLILVDQTPIFNPSHLLGFFSSIDPMAVSSLSLYKTDFPIEYTGAASSVLDIRIREGNFNKINLTAHISPIIHSFVFEGPIKKQKLSFLLTYRGSQFKWLYDNNISELKVNFYDIHAKLNFVQNHKNKYFISAFITNDNVILNRYAFAKSIHWNNFATTTRWTHIFNQKLFLNSTFSFTNYKYFVDFAIDTNYVWNSQIMRTSLKTDFTNYQTHKSTLKFGAALNFYFLAPANLNQKAYLPSSNVIEMQIYSSKELVLNETVKLKIGIVAKNWSNLGPTIVYNYQTNNLLSTDTIATKIYSNHFDTEPRFSLTIKANKYNIFKISANNSVQFIQFLSNSISPFTSVETWLPTDNNVLPVKCLQISLGYEKNKNNYIFSNQLYFKRIQNINVFVSTSTLIYNNFVFQDIRFGNSYTTGTEISYTQKISNITIDANYTLSIVLNKTPDINFNQFYFATYHKPHSLNINISYTTNRFTANALWFYISGNRFSTPIGYIKFLGYYVPIYAIRNNSKLPDYHRLDLNFVYQLNKKPRGKIQHTVNFSIINLYNRKNAVMLTFNKILQPNNTYVVQTNVLTENQISPSYIYMFNIVPMLTYTIKIQ